MCVCTGTFVNWEYKPGSKSRLHRPNRFEVDTERRISEEAVMPGIILVQTRFPFQFKDGYKLQHIGQGQFPVWDGIAENETIFEGLQSAILSAAEEGGMPQDGLKREMIADSQVVKDFGHEFRVLADDRVDRNAGLDRPAESRINKSAWRNELIEWIARAHIDVVEALCDLTVRDISLVRHFQFQRHEAETFLQLCLA